MTTTIAQFCEANKLNAKVVRAKLRRAVDAGTIKHDAGTEWLVTKPILAIINAPATTKPTAAAAPAKPTKKSAPAKKPAKTNVATAKPGADPDKAAKAEAFKARMAAARAAKKAAATTAPATAA